MVGITSPSLESAYRERFLYWLKKGYFGEMHYMNRNIEKRLNPRLVLPSAKSVICLAVNYYSDEDQSDVKIARYARGRDYHKIIAKKLKRFEQSMRDHFGESVAWKSYVDTGPVLERAFAEQAGLGFLGKNGSLITREYGSWVFLAIVLTNLELDFDRPMKRSCGSCTKCLEACPTAALVDSGVLDARRCLSYLTIEHRGDIPQEFHAKLANRVFGCDVCQEVCPYNSRPKIIEGKEWELGKCRVTLDELLSMKSENVFMARFAGTAFMRGKFAGVMRNVKIVKANKC